MSLRHFNNGWMQSGSDTEMRASSGTPDRSFAESARFMSRIVWLRRSGKAFPKRRRNLKGDWTILMLVDQSFTPFFFL